MRLYIHIDEINKHPNRLNNYIIIIYIFIENINNMKRLSI